jgi:hypothetical protein
MPELAQPLPGKVLAFSPDGAWGDAQPSIHYGGPRLLLLLGLAMMAALVAPCPCAACTRRGSSSAGGQQQGQQRQPGRSPRLIGTCSPPPLRASAPESRP